MGGEIMKTKISKRRGKIISAVILFAALLGNSCFSSLSYAADVQEDEGIPIAGTAEETDDYKDDDESETASVTESREESGESEENDESERSDESDTTEESSPVEGNENTEEISDTKINEGSLGSAMTDRAANRTQADAIQWVKSKLGQSIDADGVYGAQCVDLILAYYDYLGVPRASGNGTDYTHNALPSGWSRIQGAVPQPGDILVYTGGYGHVAIYESDYSTYHQNFNSHQYVERITYRYNGLGSPYWGVIRPNWYTPPVPSNLGDSFYAIILKRDAWKPIQNTGSNVELCTEKNISNEKWLFQRQGDGSYIIKSCFDGKVLDVYGAGTTNYTNVWTYQQWGTDNGGQKWYIYQIADDNRWRIVPKLAANMSLDVVEGYSNDGTNVHIFTQNNSNAQQFAIYKIEEHRTVLKGLYISADRTAADVDENIQLKVTFDPVDTVYNTVRWASENEDVASVDQNGKVTAKKAGTVSIKCNDTFWPNYGARITLTFRQKVTEGWKQNSTGWWYQNADGSYPKNCWKKIGNSWYHFNASGYMQTGWQEIKSEWYYFGTSGAMKTGWQKIGNSQYYFKSSGAMAVNQWIANKYYVKSNGAMARNEWVENGKYYVDGNGVWVPEKVKVTEGWKQNSTGWWYQNADGSYPKNSWKKIGNSWYHFNASGYMQTGWQKIGADWYYLGTNGAMKTGWQKIGNSWYYFKSSGAMAVDQWIANTYYVKSNGAMARNEWIGKYHVDENGKWDATR